MRLCIEYLNRFECYFLTTAADAVALVHRVNHPNFRTMFEMLQAAINKTGSTDPLKLALALEGMEVTDAFGQKNVMRKEDHQMLVPFYQALFTKNVKYDSERTGFGWKTEMTIKADELAQPTSCKMKRPAGA